MRNKIAKALKELGIDITKKTHMFRVYTARMLDDNGLDDSVRPHLHFNESPKLKIQLNYYDKHDSITIFILCILSAPANKMIKSLQAIMRLGQWLKTAVTKSYLRFYKVEALLCAAGWTRADTIKQFDCFFQLRFLIEVSEEIINELFPHIQRLKEVRVTIS